MLPKTLTIFTMGMFFPFFMSASNLIENHSFEIDDGKGVPTKWKANKAEKTNGVEHKRETGMPRMASMPQSLKMFLHKTV